MNLYRLSSVYYDSGHDYLFLGPENLTQEEFQAKCLSLLDQAADSAVKSKGDCSWFGFEGGTFSISIDSVVDHLALLLEKEGYQKLNPVQATIVGDSIGGFAEPIPYEEFYAPYDGTTQLSKESYEKIQEHNLKFYESFHKKVEQI